MRVGRRCYEDPHEDVRDTVRVGLLEFSLQHDTRTNGQHYTAADRRPANQVIAWQAERESRPTRASSS